jgi:hypothetical protein
MRSRCVRCVGDSRRDENDLEKAGLTGNEVITGTH